MSAGHSVLDLPPTMPSASVHTMPSSSAMVDDEGDITCVSLIIWDGHELTDRGQV